MAELTPVTPLPVAERDRSIDVLRGLAILYMVVVHAGRATYFAHIVQLSSYLEAASAFVLLAGFILGFLAVRRVSKIGWEQVFLYTYKRCAEIYLIHVAMTLAMTFFGELTGGFRSVPRVEEFGGWSHVIVLILTLRWMPTFMDILPMFIVFFLLSPAFLMTIRYRVPWLGVLVSVAVYILVQAYPESIEFGYVIPGMGRGFHRWCWQLVFFIGVFAGYYRFDLFLQQRSRMRNVIVWLAGVGAIGSFLFARLQGGWFGHTYHLSHDWEAVLANEYCHGPLQTITVFCSIVAGYVVARWVIARRYLEPLVRFLALFGQNSLYIFVMHIPLIFVRFVLRIREWPILYQEFVVFAVIYVLYLAARYKPATLALIHRLIDQLLPSRTAEQVPPPAR